MTVPSQGVLYATAAYLSWGVLPVYWKLLKTLGAAEILAHRVTWSCVFLAALLTARGQWPAWRAAGTQPATLRRYAIAAILLAINWGLYIWSVNTNQIVEASLGYYINPLVSVLLGTLVLGERLRRLQWAAVALAASGVVQLTLTQGRVPWIALALAVTFGLYGLTKKLSPLDAVTGLALETALLGPAAIGYLLWLGGPPAGSFGRGDGPITILLILAGVVTSLPLLWFARAAQMVPLTTLGVLQYLAPSCSLLIGVLAYAEPFPRQRAIGFVLIWSALGVFWIEGFLHARRAKCWPRRRTHH